MAEYLVTWDIEVDANSPREAAEKAEQMHKEPDNWCKVYDVQQMTGFEGLPPAQVRVDLDADEEEDIEL